jgi:hypothetical protein
VEPGLLEHQDRTWALFRGCTKIRRPFWLPPFPLHNLLPRLTRLQTQNPQWGVCDLEAVVAAFEEQGLVWVETVVIPTNNLSVVFRVGLGNC